MPNIDPQTQQLIEQLQAQLADLKRMIAFHQHLGFDSSQKLLPEHSRIKLTEQAIIATDATQGGHFFVTLKGNRTLANPTGALGGQKLVFEFIQDGTGGRTITLGSKFVLGTTIPAVTLTAGASKRDFMGVIYSDVDDKFYVVALTQGY